MVSEKLVKSALLRQVHNPDFSRAARSPFHFVIPSDEPASGEESRELLLTFSQPLKACSTRENHFGALELPTSGWLRSGIANARTPKGWR